MSAYHRGELAVQTRAGVRAFSAHVEAMIGQTIPTVAKEFLAAQPMLVIGAADPAGRRWAGTLVGRPGFLRATGDRSLVVEARPGDADPLGPVLAAPARVGAIAIDQAGRRRIRINGTAYPVDGGLRIETDQVYANCPKYIQRRIHSFVDSDDSGSVGPAQRAATLTSTQQRLIEQASTFFITTADEQGNADTSHRGGNPGFVRIVSPSRLRWPDYQGNSMFNTLGNLEVNPAAGLLFLDWQTGTTLQLTGVATVIWDTDQIGRVPGAERLVEFAVDDVVEIPSATPLRWSAPEFSRFNP